MPPGLCPYIPGLLAPFLRNGARATGGIGGRSGERTADRSDQSRENALRELRHLDSSLPLTVIGKAHFVAKAIIYLEAPGGHNGSGCTASVAEARQDRSEGFPTTRANCQPQITASQVTTSHYDRLAKRAIRQVTTCKSVN